MYRITRYGSSSNVIARGDFDRTAISRVWKLIIGRDLEASAFTNMARGHRVVRQFNADTLIVEKLP